MLKSVWLIFTCKPQDSIWWSQLTLVRCPRTVKKASGSEAVEPKMLLIKEAQLSIDKKMGIDAR